MLPVPGAAGPDELAIGVAPLADCDCGVENKLEFPDSLLGLRCEDDKDGVGGNELGGGLGADLIGSLGSIPYGLSSDK